MIPSQVILLLDDCVPLLVYDPALETTELWAVVDAHPTKDSRQVLVWEVEAVDPGIALTLDAPVATDIEEKDSLALDAPVDTDVEAEDDFWQRKHSVTTDPWAS